MKAYLTRALNAVRSIVARYPARSASYLAAVIVFVAAKAGVVVSPESVLNALLLALPVLVGGEATHHVVSPVKR